MRTWVKLGSRSRGKRLRTSSGMLAGLAGDFAVVCLRSVEQQKGVAGRRRVEDDEPVPALGYDAGGAPNTAISSVQGERKSPRALRGLSGSRFGPRASITWFM